MRHLGALTQMQTIRWLTFATVADELNFDSGRILKIVIPLRILQSLKDSMQFVSAQECTSVQPTLVDYSTVSGKCIDNSVDESLAGFCKKIEVNLEADGSVEVHDDGRGIPVDKEPKTGLTGVEVVLTKLHAGGKFGGGSYAASGGLHGVGASVVNALAERLDAEVDRNGKIYWMSFKRGVAGIFDGDGPKAPFTPQSGLRTIGKVSAKVTGTRIKWWSDRQIFLKDAELDQKISTLEHAKPHS
jgi:DNA gyrase subunit B